MDDVTGTDWSESEIDLIVADYFQMLNLELANRSYVKIHRNQELQALTGRSKGSIEFKHQNISAVLQRLGGVWIPGYKPRSNYQNALVDGVDRHLSISPVSLEIQPNPNNQFAELPQIFLGSAPELTAGDPISNERMERLVRKFDPASRDERNRTLGRLGEECALRFEKNRLIQFERRDLADDVRWVSDLDGDGAGYDILSFEPDGKERLIEVKTTVGYVRTPFYLTENERKLSEEQPNSFKLLRLYDFNREPKAFELTPPLESAVILQPTIYRAELR